MDLGYTVKTGKSFENAVSDIELKTAEKGFRVLHIHNVQETLEEKGFQREPFKIIEICNAKFAHRALELNSDVGLFMPCKINVYRKGGETIISAMRPAMIGDFFEGSELKQLANEVDSIVRNIVDESK